jgi:hypothetical protein
MFMRYPKIITFKLFGYELDIMLDKRQSRDERAEEVMRELEEMSKNLGELQPLEDEDLKQMYQDREDRKAAALDEMCDEIRSGLDDEMCDYEPTYPAVKTMKAIRKSTKKTSKKSTKKPVKKTPKK